MSILSKPYFHDEAKAYEYLEGILWPHGAVCPHCGNKERAKKMGGEATRIGLYKCYACRKQFTVKVHTVYESSHIPLHKWLQATYLMCSSKKGISALQISRTLEVTYKSAWFMCHRIREAMTMPNAGPIGGNDKMVEIDETYIGGKEKNKHANKRRKGSQGGSGKAIIVSLVERHGEIRSQHIPFVSSKALQEILQSNVKKHTYIMTDEARWYRGMMSGLKMSYEHGAVNHSEGEYVRGAIYHTNTVENYFSILKRGIVGTFHHISKQHLGRYIAEFDFRYNERKVTDSERSEAALAGITGKRLTYRHSSVVSD